MKKIYILTLLFFTLNANAIDLQATYNQAKAKVLNLLNLEKQAPEESVEVELPPIPKIVSDAKSIDVYNKSGKIYSQGAAYKKLSDTDKRKYRLAFIQELYLNVTGSSAEKSKILTALNIIEKGGSREGVYRSIVLSPDYSALEGFSESPSADLINFSYKYSIRFLAKSFSKAQMQKINLYGLKRVITEKSLEIMDSFSKDDDQLLEWYAVMSSELAKKFPLLWSGKTRPNKSALYHLKWAKSVPLQLIKSEVIIKLHKVMNSLQR